MPGYRKNVGTRFQEVFFSGFLFIILPALYLNGIHQPETSLKMPLLAAGLFFFVLFEIIYFQKKGDDALLHFAFTRKFSFWFLMLLVWMTILISGSVNPADAIVEMARMSLLFVFLVLMIYHFAQHPGRLRLYLAGPSITVIVVAAYGIIQLIGALQNSQKTGIPFLIDYAIGSTLGNKNSFAELLILCLPFSVYSWTVSGKQVKWLHALSIIACILFLFFLKSLATWVALAAGIVFFIFIWRKQILSSFKWKTGKTVAVFGLSLLLSGVVFQHYFRSDSVSQKLKIIPRYLDQEKLFEKNSQANNNSIYERVLLWRNTAMMIRENPVAGVGINNWKLFVYKYGIGGTAYISTGQVHYEHPHNDLLLVFAECGVIGVLIFILMFYFVFREGFKKLKTQAAKKDGGLLVFMLTNILMFLVLSLFGYPWSKVVVMVFLFLSIAVVYTCPEENRLQPARGGFRIHTRGILAALFVVTGFVFYAGYQRLSGEAMMYAAQDAKYKKNWHRMLRILNESDLPFYKMDAVATPVDWYRGIACYYSGQLVPAREYFLKAEEQHPYHLQVLNDLGSMYEQEGNHEKALHYYTRALEVSPLNIPALLNKSAVFFNARQADSAFITLDRVYGNRLAGDDRKRYEKTVALVLYAKAYIIIRRMELSRQPALLSRIGDKRFLRKLYIGSKRENISFENRLTEIDG